MTITRSEYLNGLHNDMMMPLSDVISKNGQTAKVESTVKLLLTIWGRYVHKISTDEMMDSDGSHNANHMLPQYTISELDEQYSDIKKCISDLKSFV